MNEWIKLRHFNDQVEADLCKAFLDGHGIPVELRSHGTPGVHPSVVFAAGIELYVEKDQFAKATELLREIEIRPLGSDEDE